MTGMRISASRSRGRDYFQQCLPHYQSDIFIIIKPSGEIGDRSAPNVEYYYERERRATAHYNMRQ